MDVNSVFGAVVEREEPDAALAAECVSGDTTAFDLLYERYSGYVYNTCLGMLGDPDDARDAMQETFVQVYRSLSGFRGQSAFCTWVYRIAINKCLDMVRRKPRHRTEPLDWFREAAAPTRDHTIEQKVRQTILRLKPDQRAVLVLFHFQQLSYTEIAEALGCSLDLVRTRLHRARKAFREIYEDGGDRS